MADYSGAYGFVDSYDPRDGTVKAAEKASILQTRVTRTVEIDFGRGPYTIEHLREFVRQTEDLPPDAKFRVNSGDSQLDGSWLTITVTQ